MDEVRSCTDLARVLECSFSAKITSAHCGGRASGPGGTDRWMLEVEGQLTGCGEEVAFIALDGEHVAASCGSWSNGVFGGCIPPEDAVSTVTWSLSRTVERAAGDVAPLEVSVLRGHGANPVLARTELSCLP